MPRHVIISQYFNIKENPLKLNQKSSTLGKLQAKKCHLEWVGKVDN